MKNVLLLLLLILLVLSVPQLRAFAAPVIDPVGEQIVVVSQPLVDRVRKPFFEWKARDEARAIIILLRDHEAIGQPLPQPRDFQEFLQRRHRSNRSGIDPWGTPYYIDYRQTDVVVGSAGADLEPKTEDDITEALPRRLR